MQKWNGFIEKSTLNGVDNLVEEVYFGLDRKSLDLLAQKENSRRKSVIKNDYLPTLAESRRYNDSIVYSGDFVDTQKNVNKKYQFTCEEYKDILFI